MSDKDTIPLDVKVVTVSRDALRADLAALELRLFQALTVELDKKANDHDLFILRAEISKTAADVTQTREAAAKALSEALSEERKTGEARFSKLESAQAKMTGAIILMAFVAPMAAKYIHIL